MESKYAKFLRETKGLTCIETNTHMVIYKMEDNVLEIYEAYAEPDFRGKGLLFKILRKLEAEAKEKGCTEMHTYAAKEYKHKDKSHSLFLKYGAQPFKETEEYIYYRKDI